MLAGPETASLSLPQTQNQQGRSSRPLAAQEDGRRTLRGGSVGGWTGVRTCAVREGRPLWAASALKRENGEQGRCSYPGPPAFWCLDAPPWPLAEWHSQAPQGRGFDQSTGSKLGCFPEAPCVHRSGKSGSQWEGKARAWERSASGQGFLTPRQAEAEQPGGPGWLLLPKDLRAWSSASLGLLYWRPGWPEGKEF